MSRWFRFYDDAINDPKILRLSDAMFRAWVTLLCLASKSDGTLPKTADIALVLRMKITKVADWLTELTVAGLLDNEDGTFRPHNWNARQYKSDVSTERVKRHRNAKGNVSSSVPETAPETEQKQITESSLRSDGARKRGARLGEEWGPSSEDWGEAIKKLTITGADQELLKFKDYWKAQPGQRGVKLDWDATFRNWIRNAKGQVNERSRNNPAADQSRSAPIIAGVAAAAERRFGGGGQPAVAEAAGTSSGPDPQFFGGR